ncbi:MAG: DUF1805 domain-containing protein [Deltaproteobacteria bacterium]|jgi:uncharacterized protein YunC (DUF1805 family)
MEIKTVPVPVGGKTAQGLMVSWDGGQFVMIVAEKGLVSCGVVDKEVMERFGAAIAIARGTPEKPLRTVEDLLAAKVADVTKKASSSFGIQAGMRAEEALKKLCV